MSVLRLRNRNSNAIIQHYLNVELFVYIDHPETRRQAKKMGRRGHGCCVKKANATKLSPPRVAVSMPPTSSNPVHWSKDFVEHLRTVHFTLIALCLGLIVLASFPSKSEIQLAHDQASEILEVSNNWKENFLESAAAEVVNTTALEDNQAKFVVADGKPAWLNFEISFGDESVRFKPKALPPSWLIKNEIPAELLPDVSSQPKSSPRFQEDWTELWTKGRPELHVKVPRSVKSFQRLWDDLLIKGFVILPKMPKECLDFESKPCNINPPSSSNSSQKPEMVFVIQTGDERAYALLHQQDVTLTKWDYQFTEAVYNPSPWPNYKRPGAVVLPVRDFATIEFDGQSALIHQFSKWNQKHRRPFKDAFRELASVDEPFEDADIGSAERILAAEAKRADEAFEAAGLKIPAEVAVRCGVLLILGVQFYMWVHLHEFGNRFGRDAGYEVAWIGVYFSKPARVLFFISLLILPLGTIVLLSIRGLTISEHHRWLGWTILVVSNAASLTLSFFILRVLPEPLVSNERHPDTPKSPQAKKHMIESGG